MRGSAIFYRLKRSWIARNIASNIATLLIVASALSGIATYSAITQEKDPLLPTPISIEGLVLINVVLLVALVFILSYKMIRLWLAQRIGSVGSRLQMHMVLMFSSIAMLPTLIVAVFAALFFHFGIQTWFNQRVGTALEESVKVSESYLEEHKKIIRADALAMAYDLSRESHEFSRNPKRFNNVVSAQATLRSLTEAIVFHRDEILARSALSFSLMFDFESLSPDILKRAAAGEVIILTNDTEDRVRALVKLNNFFDTYLLVGRPIDSEVLDYVQNTRGSVNEYQQLRGNISRIQVKFMVTFIIVAVLLLLASIWVGMLFASSLVQPITLLVKASERIKGGDLSTRVENKRHENDELGALAQAFNRMTSQLEKQRNDLVEANRQLDDRRRLTEAVLSGVSAGVMALTTARQIALVNRSALTLLGMTQEALQDKPITDILPETANLLERVNQSPEKLVQEQVTLAQQHRRATFLVRVTAELNEGKITGYIVTLDDITELQSAQRSAAWAGVARRIAHEIKNPLTPIHLAAERLKRKYMKEITSEPEMFAKYTDTIIRHVGDIGKMVEEFVSFARMPAPLFTKTNVSEIIREAVFSAQTVSSTIKITAQLPDEDVQLTADRGQLHQVMTNLIKNAMEALSEQNNATAEKKIDVRLTATKDDCTIEIIDNGPGLPPDKIDHLTDPYVTTREKGTGLGLAIVKKVISDHEGTLSLLNQMSDDGVVCGANVRVTLPRNLLESAESAKPRAS
jgi:two-component system nitrogen regulation sensor histidine kinase NtrY